MVAGRRLILLGGEEGEEGLADALFIILLAAHDPRIAGQCLALCPLLLLYAFRYCPVAFGAELPEGGGDDHGIHGAVEAAVAAGLEAEEEEHEFADFQVPVRLDDDVGALFELAVGELLAASAVLREVDELGHEPDDGGLGAVGVAHFGQRGVIGEEADVGAVAQALLHAGVHRREEVAEFTVCPDQQVGSALQVGR